MELEYKRRALLNYQVALVVIIPFLNAQWDQGALDKENKELEYQQLQVLHFYSE